MSSITSGVGLISGLPINDLVDGLMAMQRRPLVQLQSRLGVFSARRTGLMQISAQLLSIKNAISQFALPSFFDSAAATSSNPSAIVATATSGASLGDYALSVRNLAARHQLISRGFATADETAVGAGTLTIESSLGQVNRSTRLGALNGGQGVQVGRIRITDRAGSAATVDLVGAQTINDVIERINAETGIQVTARVEDDHLVLEDSSGGTGTLSVTEIGDGRTAGDLGLLQSAAGDELVGGRLIYLRAGTRLSDLNDGNGVRRRNIANDLEFTLNDGTLLKFNLSDALQQTTPLSHLNGGTGVPGGRIRITNRAGAIADVDLTGASTVQDVITRVNASGLNVSLTVSGSKFVLTDSSVGTNQTAHGPLTVEDLEGGAAQALGLAGSVSSNRLDGKNVYSVKTVGDVLRVINGAPQNRAADGSALITVAMSADGRSISVEDHTGGGNGLLVTDSDLARDLGWGSTPSGSNPPPVTTMAGGSLIAGLNTVLLKSLNGGSGVALNDFRIGDRNGGPLISVNVTAARTLDDVIQAINAAGTSIRAQVSASGLGIEISDSSGGTGNLRIQGATAEALGIVTDSATSTRKGENLQTQYVSTATLRGDFNQGAGIPSGRFRITDSLGASAIVDLTGGESTLGDIISEINSRGIGVAARINDSGDGLLLTDTAGGSGRLKVAEEGGSVAKALGILGEAALGATFIDGSLEKRIQVDGNDSLTDVLEKIRESGAAVNASLINDGSAGQSFRLSLVSSRTGLVGALAIDGGLTGLSFDTLSQARDAVVILGESQADRPLVITSSTNTLDGVISGVKLDLIATSETPVNISVRRDDEKLVQQAKTFVDAFNAVITTLDNLTRFDPETEERGILQGDATARRVRQSLAGSALAGVGELAGGLNRLGSVGIKINSSGKLELDEEKFRAELAEDPEAVENLFSLEGVDAEGEEIVVGLAGKIQREIERLTDVDNGVLSLQDESLATSETQLTRRIEQLAVLLDSKRARLLADFQAMESVLANLQSQQSALSALAGQIGTLGS